MKSITKARGVAVSKFDIDQFKTKDNDQYQRHIKELKALSLQTDCIEKTVNEAIANVNLNGARSFVIYGEPQSGKTGMMIALTARLLDEGHKIVVHLLNDSVDLLEQNLDRFRKSALSPSPKVYKDILDPEVKIGDSEFVIFCKKNSGDLQQLIDKIGHIKKKVIIDDEADYASPNSKINKGKKTPINELIELLIGGDGIYIGVTATPARLDLNNTFKNDHEKWVDFPPHNKYTGQDVFFPISLEDAGFGYRLRLLPDTVDSPRYIKEALFRFLINAAYLNLFVNANNKNYSMLIHTSGKKDDHKSDKAVIEKLLAELSDTNTAKYEKHIKEIWETAAEFYPRQQHKITSYIVENKSRADVIVLNSNQTGAKLEKAANPVSPFTIVIGGNIVSRGVTFNNLLSMYFTRDVRQKIQQDTYIQRARMFGARGDYLQCFELTIPETLYKDWHRCFVFHRLAITAIREGKGAPVWLSDNRINPTSGSSIDKSTVSFDKGEMSFALFDFDTRKERDYARITESSADNFQKIKAIKKLFGDSVLPDFLEKYIISTSFNQSDSIAVHAASSMAQRAGANVEKIERIKGFFGQSEMQKGRFPNAIHHLKIFHNNLGHARLFYKFDGSIKFIKNLKTAIEQSRYD